MIFSPILFYRPTTYRQFMNCLINIIQYTNRRGLPRVFALFCFTIIRNLCLHKTDRPMWRDGAPAVRNER